MEIRKATIADLEKAAELEIICFPPEDAASYEKIKARLETFPDCFWMHWDGDRLIGFVNGMLTDMEDLTDEMYKDAKIHDPNGKWYMIFGVATIPEYRRQGHAETVLNKVIADIKAAGKTGLVLTCKDFMVHYYEKFGFVNEGLSESDLGGNTWYQMRLVF